MTDTFGLNVNSINDPNNKLNHKVYLNIPNIHMISFEILLIKKLNNKCFNFKKIYESFNILILWIY